MILLFDTNIIIAFLKNEASVVNFFSEQDEINISSITVGEMFYGALNSNQAEQNMNLYKKFFNYCNVYKIDQNTSENYAKIRLILKTKGTPIPENDIWIAATALEHSLSIVTRDKHLLGIDFIKTISI